uniref:HpcH/HpaI aldolase/citrate lyase domain-containing protein n=1 Tax=Phaeomonas parva TaxID=124430 RepID=A0A7S1XKL5_9STRA|mmetsp:Transcript_12527/g.37675  ORF Transcript_12527/g.37675 Transcript_12527/m.37675 type:complete len:236 (+) Transcript_12527:97-804(+)
MSPRWAALFAASTTVARGPQILGWCMSGSGLAAETLATAGFDGVVVDCQHGAAGAGSSAALECLRRVALSGGTVPLARAPAGPAGGVDAAAAGALVDAGARGIIAPLISSAADAAALVAAVRYPGELPGLAGRRSWGPHAALSRGEPDDGGVLAIAMVETAEALENLDDIAATPGLDALFIGSVDLALAIGLATDALVREEPTLLDAMAATADAARRHDVKAMHSKSPITSLSLN